MLWLATVVVAPVSEELLFRGFLHRGWAPSWLGVCHVRLTRRTGAGKGVILIGWMCLKARSNDMGLIFKDRLHDDFGT
jgi:membrane protease YdiL (CAAX protease family)